MRAEQSPGNSAVISVKGPFSTGHPIASVIPAWINKTCSLNRLQRNRGAKGNNLETGRAEDDLNLHFLRVGPFH